MNKQKIISETKAIVFIVITVLLVKVTVLEAYIVPTGSMEKTIMTGDFLIGISTNHELEYRYCTCTRTVITRC
jgi:signal peptidase I